jgi:recombination protein RecA
MAISAEARKVLESINKRLGVEAVVVGEDIRADLIGHTPTGSVTLDYILHGGFPENQWTELVGEPSHGKTMLALKFVAHNQELNPDWVAVWVAAEQWSPRYAELCGVDLSRVIVIETNIMEEAYQATIDFAESKSIDAIIIDSLPALVPAPEDEKTMDEMTVGRGALLTNKFFRKVGAAMKRSLVEAERPVTGIIVNQFRMQIGVMHGDPRTTPGGKGKDYAYFVRCEVRRDEWIETGSGANKVRVGQRVKVRTIKSKVSPPQQVAYIDFYFKDHSIYEAGDYDFAKEVVSLAIVLDVVERKGAWYYYGEDKWNGQEALLNAVRSDPDLFEDFRAQVMAHTPGA